MEGLSTLPHELTLLILQHLPIDTLLSLTTVSSACNHSATSQLYRYVYLLASPKAYPRNHWPSQAPGGRHQHRGNPSSHHTRIFNEFLFLRTITKSERLRSYVVGASFTCRPDQEEAVLPIIQLLRSSLSYLHLDFTLATFYRHGTLLSAATCLDVEIPERSEIDFQSGDLKNKAYKEDIHSYFDLPNIRVLEISGVRNWNLFTQDCTERSSTSAITALCLTNTVPADPGLVRLLSWPKALKSLRFELQHSEISSGFYDLNLANATDLSAKGFSDALQSQESTLEELFIDGDSQGDRCGYDPAETINLHSFTHLKYVGLPLNYLFISRYLASFHKIHVPITAISTILPPALEELQIEMDTEYEWSSYFSPGPDDDYVKLDPGELCAFIHEIVKHKATRYTELRSIVFWQPISLSPTHIYTLEGVEGCGEVVEACKAANVHVCWDEHGAPPLFSG